jgi:maltooligosyltrehalose trehalohydrolase
VILDVVYNHVGPGNEALTAFGPYFTDGHETFWGDALDYAQRGVREWAIQNAEQWIRDFHVDGLRLDAVHAIFDDSPLHVCAELKQRAGDALVISEMEVDDWRPIEEWGHDAQWADRSHHELHVLLTGEREGYYEDYADDPAKRLARCLAEGFAYQGEPSRHRDGAPRGTPSGELPPSAFVLFLQNHDQIGNRAFGERLTTLAAAPALEAAIALQLLAPQIPLLFMGEEDASPTPFLFFSDHGGDLAGIVREGRRKEFARFAVFADPVKREQIPDPNAPETFRASMPRPDPERGAARREYYARLLTLRREEIIPRLPGCRAIGATVLGEAAVMAR